MLDLETFRKEIDDIYSEKVQHMVGALDESTIKRH
jgi:hypothetical protein